LFPSIEEARDLINRSVLDKGEYIPTRRAMLRQHESANVRGTRKRRLSVQIHDVDKKVITNVAVGRPTIMEF
jgi:hypothetical protein